MLLELARLCPLDGPVPRIVHPRRDLVDDRPRPGGEEFDRHHATLMALPGVAGTVDFVHIKRHYYESHRTINPTGIVPLGPLQPY